MLRLILALALLLPAGAACAFDHTYSDWAGVLLKYVAAGRVDYAALTRDRGQLDRFIVDCSQVKFEEYDSWSRAERTAFMINLYNAAVVQLIVNHWPVRSINSVRLYWESPWNYEFISIFGHVKALGNLQYDIIQPSLRDERVNFALVNAAESDPWLRSEPYLAERLSDQLSEQERLFMLARPDCNRFENGVLYLSSLFKWHAREFGGAPGLRIMAKRFYPDLPANVRIEYTTFDWSINAQ